MPSSLFILSGDRRIGAASCLSPGCAVMSVRKKQKKTIAPHLYIYLYIHTCTCMCKREMCPSSKMIFGNSESMDGRKYRESNLGGPNNAVRLHVLVSPFSASPSPHFNEETRVMLCVFHMLASPSSAPPPPHFKVDPAMCTRQREWKIFLGTCSQH